MKRISILVALSLFLCAIASGFQGGGGESTKPKPSPKKTSATKSSTTPPRPVVPPARPKSPTVASLMVNANLPDATVTINERTVGTTDSNGQLLLGSLKPGAYHVTITKPGYQPDKQVVNLAAGQSETLTSELTPITQALTISSTPPECEVFVDEILRGRTDASGNVRLADVPVGEHRVTIRKSRYREATFPLSLSSDKEGQINANLELAIGFLTVTTNVPNPSIDVSGLGHCDNLLSKFECKPGTYTITIASPLYVASSKEVSVSAGQEAQLSVDLEVDPAARSRLASEALEAYSSKQYDRAIKAATTLVAVDAKQSQALTVLAESYFMRDDFASFIKFGSEAIDAGGSLEFLLRHNHGAGASVMHPVRLVLTARTLSFDPLLAQDIWCSNKPFTASLTVFDAAEVSGNRDNEINLRLIFVDPDKPKKTATLTFADRESYLVEKQKSTAGGFVRYLGHTMVSRRQAYGAASAIAAVLNRAKSLMKAGNESSKAANMPPEVIFENEGTDTVPGVTAASPTVESIIEANIKAIGSPVKWNTMVLKGTYSWTYTESGNNISGAFEEYIKGRSKYFHVYTNEKIGSFIEEGYDGGIGWYKVYQKKPSPMSASEVASMKRHLVLSSLTDLKEFREVYPTAKFKGKGKLGELEVYVIEANTVDGRFETLYFDTATGLLMRKDLTYPDPQKKGTMVTTKNVYGDYVDVGGMKIPTTWRQITPILNITGKISDTLVNVPIDDAKFGMPKK